MALPKLTKLELQIMEALWTTEALSIREIQEAFPAHGRPAYTTIQTTVYRLEGKKAVRRVRKIGNAHIFEAVISRNTAQKRLIDEFLGLFGGRTQPVMAHLIESGKLTLDDVREAEKSLREGPSRNDLRLLAADIEPSLAVHSVCHCGGITNSRIKEKHGESAVLALGGGVGEIPHSLLSAG
jgi:predicted transcriptional regulator